jgi:glutathione S-transferase
MTVLGEYSHEPVIAATRFHIVYFKRSLADKDLWRVERGDKALDFIEAHLASKAEANTGSAAIRHYLVGGSLTIADIALLA